MSSFKKIDVVSEFYPRPKWRYISEGEGSGQSFRQTMLSDALNEYEKVEVNLTGYNRYGPSFISEAFGGLIREEGFRLADIEKKLIVNHELLPSIVEMCWTELKEAEEEVYG